MLGWRSSRDPIEFHDVMIALSKARAAATLLDICAFGSDYLQIPKTAITPEAERDIREWIRSLADDALTAALDEAEAAFRKSSAAIPALRDEVLGGGA